jgi:hypothetical protein
MGYKLLGMAVWKGAKWYVGRRVNVRKVAIVGGVAVLGIGAAAYVLSDTNE